MPEQPGKAIFFLRHSDDVYVVRHHAIRPNTYACGMLSATSSKSFARSGRSLNPNNQSAETPNV